jgi:hypothetical protein
MISPRHSFESVVRELRQGLHDGTIVLERQGEFEESRNRAYELGLAAGKSNIRAYTFTSTEAKGGFFFKKTVQHHLVVTFSGDTVIHIAGDVSEIQKFDIPDDIKRGLAAALSAAAAKLAEGDGSASAQSET